MASALISSILKATSDLMSFIRSTPTTSSTSTSVADDLGRLERMLERIKAVLEDAEEREIVDKSVKLWLKEIKDVAYDAEDLLDEYQYHVLQAQVESRAIEEAAAAAAEASRKSKYLDGEEEVMPFASSSSASNLAVSKITILNRMADRIKSIRKRFKEISKDRDRLQLKPEDGQRRHDNIYEYPPPTTHMVKEQEIYGREIDRENLINWLLSNKESKFEVLSVVGKGGLGKTTLAQLVYNDQKVTKYFQQRMWICVSDDFDIVRLTRAMIESISKASCTSSNQLSVLQETLQKELQEKRVLLVLDDVWNERKDLWQTLSIPFYDAEIMRIVVTTRNIPVAEVMQTTDPYRLGYLPEEQCRNLFMHHAFYRRQPEEFPLLVDIGKEIVKKCGGLPLAVKSLGGLLQNERDEDKWKDVLESEVWQSDEETGILPALKLSYIRLPSHLKPCFVICCIFPKDYMFNKDKLIKLWVAHGYIQPKFEKKSAEEIGYSYFNDLQGRSFFDKLDHYGKTKYKMHDNIHDLAHHVQAETNNKHKIRHLSIIEDEPLEFDLYDNGAIRSLLVYMFFDDGMLWTNVGRLTHLRYLSIRRHFSNDEEILLPEEIGKLICLRHFQLDTDGKIKVPKFIGNLYNLALLEIKSDALIALPETLRNLVSLTTIDIGGSNIDQLPELGQLPSLRSLTLRDFDNVISIGNEFYRGVNNRHRVAFPSLTSLVFKNMRYWEEWDEFQAGDFPRLEQLKIHRCYTLSSIPSLQNLHLLWHMSLMHCDFLQLSTEVQFPPNLQTLEHFHSDDYYPEELYFPKGFEKLKKLKRLSGIFGVRIEEVFGILKKLVNVKCLILSGLSHTALNGQACLKEYGGIENLVLDWSTHNYSALMEEKVLHLVFERDHDDGSEGDDDSDNDSENASSQCDTGTDTDSQNSSWLSDSDSENASWQCDSDSENASSQRASDSENASSQRASASSQCANDSDNASSQCASDNENASSQCANDSENASSQRASDSENASSQRASASSQCASDSDNASSQCASDNENASSQCANDSENASFSLLDSLQPHTNLENLRIVHYHGGRYPNWICDPSFKKVTCIKLVHNKIDQLPTLGQLPSLIRLYLKSISGLKRIGDEFYRSIDNNGCHDVVAFPSLIKLALNSMKDLKKWYGLRQGDFPRLQKLKLHQCSKLQSLPDLQNFHSLLELHIDQCPVIQLSSDVSPDLRTLTYRQCGARIFLSPGGKLLRLQRLNGKFGFENDEFFEILKNLVVDNDRLTITGLKNVCSILEAETNLKRLHQLQSLRLDWHNAGYDHLNVEDLILAVEDADFNDDDDETRETSLCVLEKLQPHTNLKELKIRGYNGVGYPSWIGHPSFKKLTRVKLSGCNNDQLPTLGQLPHLYALDLCSIFGLKGIGDEFCRGINNSQNVVAFPSLKTLSFKKMHDLMKWEGVRQGDFPNLYSLTIKHCSKLSSLPDLRNIGKDLNLTIYACPAIHISVE